MSNVELPRLPSFMAGNVECFSKNRHPEHSFKNRHPELKKCDETSEVGKRLRTRARVSQLCREGSDLVQADNIEKSAPLICREILLC